MPRPLPVPAPTLLPTIARSATVGALVLTPALSACAFFGLGGSRNFAPNPDPNHTHADFAIYLEGGRLDFSDPKYMSESESEEEDKDHEAHGHKHHPYLHLHDGIGHVIHRHSPGLAIGEFLDSLGFTMSENCLTLDSGVMVCPDNSTCLAQCGDERWKMFVNGNEQPFDPDYVFADMDSILLTYGSIAEEVQKQLETMTDDACRYSKTCPWRGKPPAENCIADPDVPCVAPVE